MYTSSATGHGPVRRRRGPAKVIALPIPRVQRQRRALYASVAAVVVALAAAVAVRIYMVRSVAPSIEELAGLNQPESDMLRLVNKERGLHGLGPLRFSPRLTLVARGHSYDMAIRGYHSRIDPGGGTPEQRVRGTGLTANAVAEDIYVDDDGPDRLAERVLEAWLRDADQRANLLSPDFSATGIGIARSSDGHIYVTQDFAG